MVVWVRFRARLFLRNTCLGIIWHHYMALHFMYVISMLCLCIIALYGKTCVHCSYARLAPRTHNAHDGARIVPWRCPVLAQPTREIGLSIFHEWDAYGRCMMQTFGQLRTMLHTSGMDIAIAMYSHDHGAMLHTSGMPSLPSEMHS